MVVIFTLVIIISLSCWLKLPWCHAWLKFLPSDRDLSPMVLYFVISQICDLSLSIELKLLPSTMNYIYISLPNIISNFDVVCHFYCCNLLPFSCLILFNWYSAFCVVNWHFVAPPTECNDICDFLYFLLVCILLVSALLRNKLIYFYFLRVNSTALTCVSIGQNNVFDISPLHLINVIICTWLLF